MTWCGRPPPLHRPHPFSTRVAGRHRSVWTISVDPHELLRRHQCGDWGEIHSLDRALNQHSLVDRAIVMSVYKVGKHTIWVITDAGWQTTTLLLPYER